jgi:hypothetical protein
MISLDNILSSNLQMLKDQEEQLLNSLSIVQQAKRLFEAQAVQSSRSKSFGVRLGKNIVSSKPERKIQNSRKRKKRLTGKNTSKRPSYMNSIVSILKEKNKPLSSGDLIQNLFERQTQDKDIKHFRTLIYPTLTNAYKAKKLKLKKGLIHLSKAAV